MNNEISRRLTITAIPEGFRVETEYCNRLGYCTSLSTSIVKTFPLGIVARVADRADYLIFIR